MTTNTFTTTTPDGTSVEVTYTFHKGYAASWDEPGEPDSVEIQSVVPDVPDADYAALVDAAHEDHANYLADAAEWRAEAAREDRWRDGE